MTVAELVQTVIGVSGKDIRADSLSQTRYVEGPVGMPCLTLRENTERPVTVTKIHNLIVGTFELAPRGKSEV